MTAPKLLPGADVASFQGPPDTWQEAAGAIRWAAVKISEVAVNAAGEVTAYVNPDAGADWAYLAENKLGRIAYLFAHPSAPVGPTVALFQSVMHDLGLDDSDGIAIDFETNDDPSGNALGPNGVTPAEGAAWAAEVAAELDKLYDRDPALYTFLSFAEEGYTARLGHLPLWMSDPSSPKGEPRVPAPWTDWAIDQYSTSNPIDRDVAKYPSLTAMQAALGKRKPKPPPEDSMQMIHAVTLADVTDVPPGGKPVVLRWKGEPGEPSKLNGQHDAAEPGAGTMLSSANLHVADATKLRFTLAEMLSDGKPGRAVHSDYEPAGGWRMFTAPLQAKAGASYMITVANFGPTLAKVTEGNWEIVR